MTHPHNHQPHKHKHKAQGHPDRRTEREENQVGNYYEGPDRYYDQVHEISVIKLYSGDYYVAKQPGEMIMTILGSCVAACIRDPFMGIGGMNHFLLPGDKEQQAFDASTRYGVFAMEKLINEILKAGGVKKRLEVKLFGGANVIEASTLIGERNVEFVRRFMKEEGLKVDSEHLGGIHPRRLHYYPSTGQAMMRSLKRKDDLRVVAEERAYARKLKEKQKKSEDDIELF